MTRHWPAVLAVNLALAALYVLFTRGGIPFVKLLASIAGVLIVPWAIIGSLAGIVWLASRSPARWINPWIVTGCIGALLTFAAIGHHIGRRGDPLKGFIPHDYTQDQPR